MPSPSDPTSIDLNAEPPRRFDDRAATVLAGLSGDRAARRTAWRQAIDLLTQPGRDRASDGALVAAIEAANGEIDPATRAEAARAAAFGTPPHALVLLFGNDRSAIAAELLRSLWLSADDWAQLLPRLSPVARGILRARRDLDGETQARLQGFGRIDFALPPADETGEETNGAGMTRIADLVARIEAYRQTRRPVAAVPDRAPPLEAFAFETDGSGTIGWTDAPDRAPIIGLSIGRLAEPGGAGVDGVAYGAVRRRCAFREARLLVAGDGPASGDWRISAVPSFDDASGRCVGYRGTAARPRADQRADQRPDLGTQPADAALAGDALRQVVHELRTPLNAIGGFAELISGQIMGPVAAPYRSAASDIGFDAQRVIAAIDDLDVAVRIDAATLADRGGVAPFVHAARISLTAHEPALAARGASLVLAGGDIAGAVIGDAQLVDRLVHRFVGAFAPFAAAGEALMVSLSEAHGRCELALDRPQALAGADRAAILAGEVTAPPAPDQALLLGLGFAARFVTGLARSLGGGVLLDGERLTLWLPAAANAQVEDIGGA